MINFLNAVTDSSGTGILILIAIAIFVITILITRIIKAFVSNKQGSGILGFLTKIILIIAVIGFGLWHYDIFVSTDKFAQTNNPIEVINNIASVNEITYYKDPFFSGNYIVIIHANVNHKTTLNESEINGLKLLNIFTSKVHEVQKCPSWVLGIIILVVALFPTRRISLANNNA